jgi:hypothetical protein
MDLDENDGLFGPPETEPLMIEGDDAGVPRLHHADFDSRTEPHFIETADEVHIPVDVEDASRFAGLKQVQRNDVRHGGRDGTGRAIPIEIQSQSRTFYHEWQRQ